MRLLLTLLFITSMAYGQTLVPFGGTRTTDTAYAARSLRIDSVVRFVKYGSADSNKVLGVDAGGKIVLRTKWAGGSTDSNVFSTIGRLYKVADSVAGEIPDVSIYAPLDTLPYYVPYTGATSNVNLGNYRLTTKKVVSDTVMASGSMGLHLHSTSNVGIMIGAGGGGNITFDSYPTTTTGDSVLSTNGSGGVVQYNLKSKLANYQLNSDTSTWDATRAWVNGQIPSLTGYQQYSDTTTFDATKAYVNTAVSGKMNYTDTAGLSARINTKQSYSDTTTWDATKANIASKVNYSDTSTIIGTKANLNLKMNYTDTVALSNRINTKQNFTDTSTFDATRSWVISQGYTGNTGTVTSVGSGFGLSGGAITTSGTLRVDTTNVPTQYRVDTTAQNALTRINTKGSGTVTSIQLVAGSGVSITPTTAVTTSGTYTISATGSTGVQSITSTNGSMLVSGTTTVNIAIDTTKPTIWTSSQTYIADIVVDSVNIGSGNGLSTNVRVGRTAFPSGTTATRITAIGENAGNKVTIGTDLTFVGHSSGANTSVSVNGLVGVGRNTLNYSTGDNNTAIGTSCMARAVAWNGIANAGVGANSGNALTSGSSNSWIGAGAGNALTSGSSNTFLGVNSGTLITTGGSNVVLGSYTGNIGGLDIRTLSNRVVISDGGGNIRAYHNSTNWLIGTVTDGSTGILQLSGSLGLNTAGNKLNIATGSNASVGTATLVAGTVTVTTTAITASSIVLLTGISTGAPPCTTCGALSLGTITAGTSFVINSALSTDTRVVQYVIIN